ncbi:tyrosine serine phosphatase [Pyrrhoderma noxium]|uniref:Tyrosine serine phosphatase n=1 Tax=Pyrrhoderma noxium TaxID=2282107 RepID=A0A286UWU0_9AGAM|nr:tyrosine serine phosphatase [Pyrrhoderma noxium]
MDQDLKIDSPDPELVKQVLSSSPFQTIEGVINFREYGFLSAQTKIDSPPIPLVRPGILYRSGELTRLTETGKAQLKNLGITTVFDFRSETEILKYKSATPEIKGMKFVHVPVSDTGEYDPMALAARVAKFASDEKSAFAALYSGILENGGPAFETVLRHLKDRPGEPCLIHCTAGKDRTGVFAAILQLLLGADDDSIAHDYNLTTYGLAPVLPALVARFQKESVYRDNWAGFRNMGSAKKETMYATLKLLRSKYGSAEGYITQMTSLTSADIVLIRRNLLSNTRYAVTDSESGLKDTTVLVRDQGYAARLLEFLARTWIVQWIAVLISAVKSFTSCLVA